MLNKSEYVEAIEERTCLSTSDSQTVLKAFVDIVLEQIQDREKEKDNNEIG